MDDRRTLVSVVTPCFNAAATIEKTIRCVLEQTYESIEYIVVDGGSTDGTLDILGRYADRLTLISEPDSGQSNAINKGLRLAKGEILAFLNADDLYMPTTVATAMAYLDAHPEAAWVYGTSESIGADGRALPFNQSTFPWDYDKLLTLGCYINQPTTFLRREIVDEFGYFDESLNYVMDYEYWLRIGRRLPGHFVPSIRTIDDRSRTTKTQSGGSDRIDELMAVVQRYGGHDVPVYTRHRWAIAREKALISYLRKGQVRQIGGELRALSRYPSAALWAIVKVVIRATLSESSEAKLRRLLLRKAPAAS